MFTSRKDEEIEELKAKVEELKLHLKTEEKIRLDNGLQADREHTNHLIYKNEMTQKEGKLNAEIARLRRIVAAEKQKRINSSCANRRRLSGRAKTELKE